MRGVLYDTFEPANDFWLSSGQFHLWNPGQKKPATPWEAEIDGLMKKQSTTTDLAERRRIVRRGRSGSSPSISR